MFEVWDLGNIIMGVFLTCCAWMDIRSRGISAWILWAGTGTAILLRCLKWNLPFLLCLAGVGIGLFFFGISKITKEAFGYGDSWMILILGMYMGAWKIVILLSIAFLLCGIAGACYITKGAVMKKMTLPFMPFLAIGYWGALIL